MKLVRRASNSSVRFYSVLILRKLILSSNFLSHLVELRLGNIRLNRTCLTVLFESLSTNTTLEKLGLSNMNINEGKPLQLFLDFLSNDNLIELDISLGGFNTQ
jgi:hypothetical protein